MKPEEINGVMYQPVLDGTHVGSAGCDNCVFFDDCFLVNAPCEPKDRDDGLSVYFIEIDSPSEDALLPDAQAERIKELEKALQDLVDGESAHDMVPATGLSLERCQEIIDIAYKK